MWGGVEGAAGAEFPSSIKDCADGIKEGVGILGEEKRGILLSLSGHNYFLLL